MCNMSDYMIDRGRLDAARNIMEGLNFTIEQTLDLLKIEEYDRPWFIDHLEDDEY
ncbi:MAG: hypothetical protein LUG46_03275 [Erysipelotrichaceae bacterium]|nr:hypothetical protein [Erysipelotrichaceae bacterium]